MNVIFVTQGAFAFFYLELLPLLGQKHDSSRVGFYVTHKANYPRYREAAEKSGFEISFLKEWEITSTTDNTTCKPDRKFLKQVEQEFGDPFLWDALVMDRRVYNGILTKYKQDYKPRFTHDQMLCLLQEGFKAVAGFVDDIKPDVIVGGFTPVTFVEYIFYLYAKSKGIKYINLNPTKILNYVTFSGELCRQFPHIADDYKKYKERSDAGDKSDTFWEKAQHYTKGKLDRYEGVVVSCPAFPLNKWFKSIFNWPLVVAGYLLKKQYLDNQVRGSHWGYFFKNIYGPCKDKIVRSLVPYCPVDKLSSMEYAYYPLHVEPEIALSLFGREHLNQIELIRNIAKSMPVTWKLVVKDHPAGVGRRNVRYYKKLLEIPNVVLVNHWANSDHIIDNAKLVLTVSGFSGFEAVLKHKPVITFGTTFYNILPGQMVRNIRHLGELPLVIKELIEGYKYSDNDVNCLVAAIMKNSVQLNLYADVLRKQGRVVVQSKALEEQKRDFATYLAEQI